MADTTAGPALTSANVAKPLIDTAAVKLAAATLAATAQKIAAKQSGGAVAVEDEQIIAKPLVTADFMNVRLKNPMLQPRWVLHTLYKNNGEQSGLRYEQAKVQGYAPVVEADLAEPEKLGLYSRDGGTKYINGDVILMKINKAAYQGALLHAAQKARAAVTVNAADKRNRQELRQAISEVPSGQRSQASKISAITPTREELKAFGMTDEELDEQVAQSAKF
jgi:hypothetical protein